MLAYFIMYLVVIIGVINQKKTKYGYFAWSILLVFSVFRGDHVGTDTKNYLDSDFSTFRAGIRYGMNSSSSLEVLTNFLARIVDSGANPRLIITVFSVVTFVFLLLLARRSKINIAFLMMVFLLGGGYVYSFNISRQWSAIAIIAFAVTYIFDSDKKKSLLFFPFVILATGIHAAAIYYVILYVFRFIKLNFSVLVIIVLSCFVISSLSLVSFDTFYSGFAGYYMDLYGDAINVQVERNLMGKVLSFYFTVLYILMMIRLEKHDAQYLVPLFAFCIGMNLLTNQMESVIHRFFMFLSFLVSVFVAKYFSVEKDKNTQTLFLMAYLVITTYLFFTSGFYDDYYFSFKIF